MACAGTPTSTQFTTVTSTGTTTTFSDSVSTPPDSVSTTVTQSCPASGPNTACVDVIIIITIPGVPSTAQIPVTLTDVFTQTLPTETLFASCSDGPAPADSGSSSPTSTPPTPGPGGSNTSKINSVVITRIVTSTQSTAALPTSTSVSVSNVQHDNGGTRTKMVPIISSAVGGFVGLICLVGFLWFLIRRRNRWGDRYDREDDMFSVRRTHDRHGRFDLNADVEPKPYQYGLVGYTTAPPTGASPPGSPPPLSSTGGNATPHSHRRSSIGPPVVPSIRTTNSSRPSTGGSTQPLQRRPTATEYAVRRPAAHHAQHSSGSSKLSQPVTVASRNPMAEFGSSDGSPTSIYEPRRQLQIVNAPLSPAVSLGSPQDAPEASSSAVGSGTAKKGKKGKRQNSAGVIVHTDGGRVDPDGAKADAANRPPAYDA